MELKNTNNQIESDSKFILKFIKDLFIFIITLIPYLFLALINLFLLNTEDSKNYFKKIFVVPFQLFQNFSTWFFQAKFTAIITLTLIFTFLIQIIFINPNQILLETLMTNPNHLTSLNIFSLLTSIFLHGNLSHLISNLIALTIFGRIVENHFKIHIISIFLASGIIANLFSNLISLINNDVFFSLGASGGIAGLIIMAILLNPFQFTSLFIIPLPIFIIGWIIIFLDIMGLSNPSQTNHLAHIGGYLSLIILMFTIKIKNRKKIYIGLIINISLILILYILTKTLELTTLKNILF